jgi:hypothetical protein
LEWELNRKQEATDILKTGKRVYKTDLERHEKAGTPLDFAVTCVGLFVQLWEPIFECKQAQLILSSLRVPWNKTLNICEKI